MNRLEHLELARRFLEEAIMEALRRRIQPEIEAG